MNLSLKHLQKNKGRIWEVCHVVGWSLHSFSVLGFQVGVREFRFNQVLNVELLKFCVKIFE